MAGIPDDLIAELHSRYGLGGAAEQIAPGLSASKMWRLNSTPPVVVRVSEQWPPPDQVRRSCAVAANFARTITQVPAPLIAGDGSTAFMWQDLPVVVWPFVDGNPLDRHDETHRRAAARVLADLHRTALDFTGPTPDASTATYATRPSGPNPPGVPEDPELDDWLSHWQAHHAPADINGWMHGDFFHGNILCDGNNNVTGLIDWDDAQYGPLVTELASATWEFTCTPDRDSLAISAAQQFLTTYAKAGGPVQPGDEIVPLIRVRLRSSVAFFRILQEHGHKLDIDHERATIAAFTALRDIALYAGEYDAHRYPDQAHSRFQRS